LFTYYADTLNYIYSEIMKDGRFSKLKIEAISSSGITSKSPQERETIIKQFFEKRVDIILSTDVLSEGQNLQTAKFLINYDLHWNPTRMIQRAGRIDRIGSPYKEIFVYNFFPEDELEELLKLVEILQNKIIGIDEAVGLDQTILGEEIHPKVFGIIRRIKGKDEKVFAELEKDIFGGGEIFYQPLKDFLKNKGVDELEKIRMVYSVD
ncbi:Snf2 family RNA helicase, partial [mine drainage metagenome]